MKGINKTKILLLMGYCIPFAFLAVYIDATDGKLSLFSYLFMIAGFSILCRYALKTKNDSIVLIGNILSFASSLITAKLSGLEPMAHYFKPLTSYLLIILISVIAIIVNAVIVIIMKIPISDTPISNRENPSDLAKK